jgi:hypothetical protein
MCDHPSRHKPRNGLDAAFEQLFRSGDATAAASHRDAGQRHKPAAAATPPARRKKFWELEEKHHCPVIGTCLGIEELKKITRREGFSGNGFDDYRLHVEAVSASCMRNAAAEAMHKLLEQKFAQSIKAFEQAKSDAHVLALWQQHLARGEVAGPMWAALSHKCASEDTRNQVYADVHMLSHQIGAGLAADARRLGFLENETRRLAGEAHQEAARTRRLLNQRDARIRDLEADNQRQSEAMRELPALKSRVLALESGQVMVDMGRRLLLLESHNAKLQAALIEARQLEDAAAENTRLKRERATLMAERDAMERLLLSDSPDTDTPEREAGCNQDCGRCDSRLQDRCILCVGGRTALLPQYRQLAERLGIRLIHHDGGKEEALSRLPALLASSEAVICPTDCVGHMAYYQLKQHCKQAGKPCVLMKSSGVASFAAALTRLAEGKADIQPD